MSTTYGPYTPIRQAGNLFFVSGQVGVDAQKHATDSVAEQTRQALENLSSILTSAGLTADDVVKTTVFLTNMNDFAVVNQIFIDFFETPRPARSCVAVAELPRVADNPLFVEIEAIACKEFNQ